MADNSDTSALPTSGDPAGVATSAEPIDPARGSNPGDPTDNGREDVGDGPGDERKPPRGNPWDTFRFKRVGGLERRTRDPKPRADE